MSVIPRPAVPYSATAVRPAWADLPEELRAAIAGRLGSPVVWATTATAGFTSGFAGVLDTAAGEKAFVKAARLVDQRHLCDWYAHEAQVTAALPAEVAAPRPRWTLTVAGHFVVCMEAVEAHVPSIPWTPDDLTAALTTWATASAALVDPPAELVDLGLPTLETLARNDLSWWREIVDGRSPLPPFASPARDHVTALAALESALPPLAAASARALTHGDLRVDNVLIADDGQTWLCDWNWICHGPAWFDTAALLISAYASGLDADALWATHPTTESAPPEALDASLAALSGYFLTRATAEPTDASPHLRQHQRWSGEAALSWLLTRQGRS